MRASFPILIVTLTGILGSFAQGLIDEPQEGYEEVDLPRATRRHQPPHHVGSNVARKLQAALNLHSAENHEGSTVLTCGEIATAAKNCHEMRVKTTKIAVVWKKRFLAERKQLAASQATVHRLQKQLKEMKAANEDVDAQMRKDRDDAAREKLELDEFKNKLADAVQGETELATDLRIAQDNLANRTAEEIGVAALREQLTAEHMARKTAEKAKTLDEHTLFILKSKLKGSNAKLEKDESEVAVQTKDLRTAVNEIAALQSQVSVNQQREHETEVASKARAEMDALEVQAAQRALNSTRADLLVAKTEAEEFRISRDHVLALSSSMENNQASGIIKLREESAKGDKLLQSVEEELKSKVQALNATTHDLANALEVAKEQKDLRAKESETLSRRNQQAVSYSEQLAEANHELEAIREELGSKDRELSASRSSLSEVESQDKEDKETLKFAQAAVKEESVKLNATRSALHDRESRLHDAEANVALEREQFHNLLEQVHQTDSASANQAKAEAVSLQATLDKTEVGMNVLRADARAQQEQAKEKDAKLERLAVQLRAAQVDNARLNSTQVEVAKELGVSPQQLQVSSVQAVDDFRQMHARLVEADEELKADRAALYAKDLALNTTQVQFKNARARASTEGLLRDKVAEAETMMESFHTQLANHEMELNRTKLLLSSAEAEAGQLPVLRAKLASADKDLDVLQSTLARKVQDLNTTRTQLGETTRAVQSMNDTRRQLSAKLNVTRQQLQSTHEDLKAEDSKLNATRRHLAATMAAVKDLDEIRSKLDAADKELKQFKAALSAKSNEVVATREEADAAEKLRIANGKAAAAELEDLETLKAKIKIDRATLLSMKSKMEKKDMDLRVERRDLSDEAFALRSAQLQLSEKQAELQGVNASHRKLAMLKYAEAGKVSQLNSDLNKEHLELETTKSKLSKVVAMATHDIAEQDKEKQAVEDQLEEARANITDLTRAVNSSKWYETELVSMTSVLKQARDELNTKNSDLKVVADALVAKNGEVDRNVHLLQETSKRADVDEQALKQSHTDELDMKRFIQQEHEEFAAKLDAKDKEMAKEHADMASEAQRELNVLDHKLKTVESEDGLKFRAAKAALDEARGAQTEIVSFRSRASKAEGEVKQATSLLKRDEVLLRNSYAKQDHLKRAMATKYGKLARDLKKEKHHESDMARKNQALEKEVRYLRSQVN